MRRRGISGWAFTALALSLFVSGVAEVRGAVSPRVVAVRHFSSRAHTRIVVELSAPAVPAVRALPEGEAVRPTRLYLDLPGIDVGAGVAKSLSLPVGPLEALRVGKRDLVTTRLVIMLREVEGYELSRLSGPPRVVLDVRAPTERLPSQKARENPSGSKEARVHSGGKPTPQQQRGRATASTPQVARNKAAKGETRERRAVAQAPESRPEKQATRTRRAARSSGIAPLKVVIDPGHGGRDTGARSASGLLEKTLVLGISRDVASRLRKELGASVVLTRDRDAYVSLEARTALANAERADLFISIHANANTVRRLSGVETYYLENTNDRATLRLAAMENGLTLIDKAPRARSHDLSYILSDLVQRGKLQDSIDLSNALHQGLVKRLRKKHRGVVDLGVKRGPFYVLVGAYMPCALVEVGFLTNRSEAKRLATEKYRSAIAEGVVEGVRTYVTAVGRGRTL